MAIYGLPMNSKPKENFTIDVFKTFIPKLADYVDDHISSFNTFKGICEKKLMYGFWTDDWLYAMSLAVAHYICITDPQSIQSIDGDSTAGGIMSSRTVDGISYNYDTDKMINNAPAYKFWNTTGYGRTLVNLSLNRGTPGMLITS